MKKVILIFGCALLISGSVVAQDAGKTQKMTRKQERVHVESNDQAIHQDGTKIRTRKQERIHNEASNHGQDVSAVAQNTESGQGKGEIVSQEARTQGDAQKTGSMVRNQQAGRLNGARGASMQQNSMRMQRGAGHGRK